MNFEWDENNTAKVLAHGLSLTEAQEAYEDPAALDLGTQYHRSGEIRSVTLGEAGSRKIIVVVAIDWSQDTIRIITAFPASPSLIRFYRE